MRIAVVVNTRPPDGQGRGPDDRYEEFDSPETVLALVEAIASLGHQAWALEADRDLPGRLAASPPDLVFNIAEGFVGRSREAHVPAFCEWFGIPYTGSDPLTLAATLDKWVAKRIVTPDVPVPRGWVVERIEGIETVEDAFPLFVKPNAEGSSKGIRKGGLVHDREALADCVRALLADYGGAVLVEEYLPGVDLTVGVVGNELAEVVGVMEVSASGSSGGSFIYGIEEKRDWRRQVAYHVPPRIPEPAIRLAERYALAAYRLLGCRDVARVDFRLDAAGTPRFLEVNPLPGLSPVSGDLVILARRGSGIGYRDLLARILLAAQQRLGLRETVGAAGAALEG